MFKIKTSLLIFVSMLILSCASDSYLGTKQTRLAAEACPIEESQCYRLFEGLDNNGRTYSLDVYYKLENVDSGNYMFNGSARLRHEHPAMENIRRMDLYFVFFNDEVVVHEEKIAVKGGLDEYNKFSRLIKSDVEFKSSYWINFGWLATE